MIGAAGELELESMELSLGGTGASASATDGLLPHERAARDRRYSARLLIPRTMPNVLVSRQCRSPDTRPDSSPRAPSTDASMHHRRARKPIFNPNAPDSSPPDQRLTTSSDRQPATGGTPPTASDTCCSSPSRLSVKVTSSSNAEEPKQENEEWGQLLEEELPGLPKSTSREET